jgi:hypothetical protein
MLSAFFRGFQTTPTTNNTIPMTSIPTRGAEKPFRIRKMAPKAVRMHPAIKNLNFI